MLFQLIIGIYLIEIVSLITLFLSRIENGEEGIIVRLMIAKRLIIALIIYIIAVVSIYWTFSSMMPIGELIS